MMRRFSAIIASSFAAVMAPLAAQNGPQAEVPDAPMIALEQLIVDKADLFTPAFTDAMNARLKSVEQRTGASFVLLTLPSLEGQESEDLAHQALTAVLEEKPRSVVGAILLLVPTERVMVYQSLHLAITDEQAQTDGLSDEERERSMQQGLAMAERIGPKLSDLASKYYSEGDWQSGTAAIVDMIERDAQALEPLKRDSDEDAESDRAA